MAGDLAAEFKAYQDRLVRLMAEPDVQALLQAFPGAEIEKIEADNAPQN